MMRGKLNFFGQTVGRRGHSFLMMWDILDVQAKEKRKSLLGKKPAWPQYWHQSIHPTVASCLFVLALLLSQGRYHTISPLS